VGDRNDGSAAPVGSTSSINSSPEEELSTGEVLTEDASVFGVLCHNDMPAIMDPQACLGTSQLLKPEPKRKLLLQTLSQESIILKSQPQRSPK